MKSKTYHDTEDSLSTDDEDETWIFVPPLSTLQLDACRYPLDDRVGNISVDTSVNAFEQDALLVREGRRSLIGIEQRAVVMLEEGFAQLTTRR